MRTQSGGNELLNIKELLRHAGVATHMTVADLGCGNAGFFTLAAGHMVGEQGTVYAVDVVRSVLNSVEGAAKLAGLHNIRPVWSNVERYGKTTIPPGSVDVALLINILFQSKKQKDILKETGRLVKPGGRILVVDWKNAPTPLGPPPLDRVSPEELRKAAQELRLKEIDSFEAGEFHFGLLFQKS